MERQGELSHSVDRNQDHSLRLSQLLPTQELIDHLAERIDNAYSLRRPRWWQGCSTPRVWNAAAHRLWQVHEENPSQIPLDPELYVASQSISGQFSDPWIELAGPKAGRHYRARVYRIIEVLSSGLKKEVRLAERAIRKGQDISNVLKIKPGRLSHLGCYIVARRAGRADLAVRFADAANEQRRFCPLYRSACLALIPGELNPVESMGFEHRSAVAALAAKAASPLN
jgi:hypothetical protein